MRTQTVLSWASCTLIAGGASGASIVTETSVHRIPRGTINCAADTATSALLCDTDQGPFGLRIVPNVAEAVLSPGIHSNGQFRMRVGLLVPRVAQKFVADCNANGVPDECDIDDGTSVDCNHNEIPDECECFAVEAPAAEAPAVGKNRYLSFVPGSVGCTTALRVTLTGAPPPFGESVGSQYWVGAPWRVTELSGSAGSLPEPAFWAARLECTPHCDDWGQTGLIHVLDESVIPSAAYEIQAIACGCNIAEPGAYSAPLPVSTPRWGDIVGGNNDQPPNGVVDFVDISCVVDKFKNLPGAPIKSRADVTPRNPDRIIDFNDIPAVVDAFRGLPYPYDGPHECP